MSIDNKNYIYKIFSKPFIHNQKYKPEFALLFFDFTVSV